jgi:hypothetical protein
MKVAEMQELLVKLTNEQKSLNDQVEDLRFELNKKMKEGEYMKLQVNGKYYRVMREPKETRVLHDTAFIAKTIGKEAFLKIAKVSIKTLETAVGKEEIGKFIARVDTSYSVTVRDAEPNGNNK